MSRSCLIKIIYSRKSFSKDYKYSGKSQIPISSNKLHTLTWKIITITTSREKFSSEVISVTGISGTFIVKRFLSILEGFQCRVTTNTMLAASIFTVSSAINLKKSLTTFRNLLLLQQYMSNILSHNIQLRISTICPNFMLWSY